jgi:integrase
MIRHFFKEDRAISRLRRNYLFEFLQEMAAQYHEERYGFHYAADSIRSAAYFGSWLKEHGIPPSKVTHTHGKQFLSQFIKPWNTFFGATSQKHNGGLRAGVTLVIEKIHLKWPPKPKRLSRIEGELEKYASFLRFNIGIGESSIRNRSVKGVRLFLQAIFMDGPIRPNRITPIMVHDYVMMKMEHYKPKTVQCAVVSVLRNFFRYWALQGQKTEHLIAALPLIPTSRHCVSPKIMTEQHLNQLWESFDNTTATGRRDYAAIRCMGDLGMRAADVTRLKIDDIDWQNSTMYVENRKGAKPIILPLTQSVGEALADYLRHGRPDSRSRFIFLRHQAPYREASNSEMLRTAMYRALKRAKLNDRYSGTHILRHTAATRMRLNRAPVKDIADILGHSSLQATMMYAQIDYPVLRAVAQSWPEGGSR